jgi:hypothetical protein
MDDDPRADPTSRLLGDFVRHVSGQVVIPVFAGEPRRTHRRSRRQRVRRLAVVFSALVVAAVVAVIVAYGPRSSRIGPHPSPATQPTLGSTSTTSVTSGTQEITYDPFTTSGISPSLHVTSQVTGTCIRYGRGTTGHVYFRCFATGGGIYDPCFAGPRDTNAPLVCPTDPTSSEVVALTATTVTSDGPPSPSVIPWAMQLSSGQVCLFVSAAWSGLGPYGCQPGPSPQPVADCHTPQSSRPLWTAACQDQETDASPFASKDVVRVWF